MGTFELYTRAAIAEWLRTTWLRPDVREVILVDETPDEVTYRIVREDGLSDANTSLQTFRLALEQPSQS